MIDNYWGTLLHYSFFLAIEIFVISCIGMVFLRATHRNEHDESQGTFSIPMKTLLGFSVFCLTVFVINASAQFFVLALQTLLVSVIILLMFVGVLIVAGVFWFSVKEDYHKYTQKTTHENVQEKHSSNTEFDISEQELAYLEYDIY